MSDACVPLAPPSWQGPIAYWDGKAGARPDCPDGYAKPTDLHHDLDAPDGACNCKCTALDQVCNTTLRLYSDKSCDSPCATTSLPACAAVSGCVGSQGSVRADLPTPSGGRCEAMVPPVPEAKWKSDARICRATGANSCPNSTQVCAPFPQWPYVTELCIMRVIQAGLQAPPCPSSYPNATPTLYEEEGISDQRNCSACTCGSVSGGSCSGTASISVGGDCSTGTPPYKLGDPCQVFDLGPGGVHPARVGPTYNLVPGTCGIATPSLPTGSAAPSGNITVVCCQ